jgi:hypothetical protein
MKRTRIVTVALSVLPMVAHAQTATLDSAAWWRDAARKDLAAAREIMNTKFITALNTPGPSWAATLDGALRDTERDVDRVRDAATYQSVLKHFVSAFDDAHVRVRFTGNRILPQEWPGFLVRYDGRHFVVVDSDRRDVQVGSAITGCDAKPIDQVLTEIMPYEQVRRHLELESTRTALARILFVDAVGSLRPRLSRCRIAGHDVALNWQPITANRLTQLNAAHAPYSNNETSISAFGKNGAWVRMSTFGPNGESAKQFAKIIEQAPTLRTKDVIVFDVRGNGGGSYNWFMGFLDALYGEPYADYYARARLQFANVMSGDLGGGRGAGGRGAGRGNAPADAPRTPPDRGLGDLASRTTTRPGANGATLRVIAAPDSSGLPRTPPPNPVRARVLVLTDNGCASACISFVDEMRRFPGVFQIGRDTYVDSRPGSPMNHELPSGEASISVPSMVREVRERGDNFAWKPDTYFDGDIADTGKVQAWILNVVVPSLGRQ